MKSQVDLSLYLVTDHTPKILGEKDICHVVEEAIKGGVTIVQYRDKHVETHELISTASKLLQITKAHNVPLLINDRLDVCLAVGADGVHIGQDDMPLHVAKKLLPVTSIIGVTVSSVEEANAAIDGGADYLGIGTVFATPTKTDTKSIIGTQGLRSILSQCRTGTKNDVGCVAIGSINADNVQRVLHQSQTDGGNRLNGVAVVSAIVASADPQQAASDLRQRIQNISQTFYSSSKPGQPSKTLEDMLNQVPQLIAKHATASVLSHNMTNTVVQNFAANVCLATGASPIMSMNADEAADLAKLSGGLVINMGTITPDALAAYRAGLKAYNAAGNPTLLDPVGGGATAVRRETIRTLLKAGYFDLIKGNEGEIGAVLGSSITQQRGVDSGPSTSTAEDKTKMVGELARKEGCLVLMTGSVDYLSDGTRTVAISNGSPWLGKITGSGCALGSVLVSYLAMHKDDKFSSALAGILHYEIAAERAEKHEHCRGPGTFIPSFLDELCAVGKEAADIAFTDLAKVTEVQ